MKLLPSLYRMSTHWLWALGLCAGLAGCGPDTVGAAATAAKLQADSAERAQAQADAKRFELSDLRYRNGVASYLDLLDAQRSLFATEQSLVVTRLQQLQNQVTLYKVLGGGWTAPAEETPRS